MSTPTISQKFPRFLFLALLAAAAPACGHSDASMQVQRDRVRSLEEATARQRAERADLERRAHDADERNRMLAEAVRGLGGNVEILEGERRDLTSSVTELQTERAQLAASLRDAHTAVDALRAREAQAEARARLFRTMLERFRSMIDAGQLRVRVTRNRMVVELPEGVLFDTGRDELKATGQHVLERVSEVLRGMERDFQIAGHTDNVPIHNARFASNWELSTARALNVSRFLLGHGLAPQRLSAAGYADTQPEATNDSPEGRRQNRRIEIVLVPALDELPDLSALRELAATPASPAR